MAKNTFGYLVICSLILLSGCGFQLRGSDISQIDALSLGGAMSAESRRVLRASFERHGVDLVPATADVVSIRILDERSGRRPISTSARVDAAQYELRLEFDVAIAAGGEVVLPELTVAAERVYSVDSQNLSGSYEEQQILMRDIREELAMMIIRRIEAWVESRNAAAA